MKHRNEFSALLSVSFVSLLILSVFTGSVSISVKDILTCLLRPNNADQAVLYIVRNMRIPRTLGAAACGGILALCGMLFQSIFRNPMADSYILGISSGSSFAVAVFLVSGVALSTNIPLPLVSFAGSTVTALILFFLSSFRPFTVLLTGLSLNYLLSAATTLLIYIGQRKADSVLFWIMGSLASIDIKSLAVILPVCAAVFLLCIISAPALDVMLLDDSTASSSGINVTSFRMFMLVAASVGTSAVVAYCGVIGFIGLMSPHIVRLVYGPGHRRLVKMSFLMGACILLLSDIIARTVLAPGEIPVGIITSVSGAPVLFFLLRRRRKWMQ